MQRLVVLSQRFCYDTWKLLDIVIKHRSSLDVAAAVAQALKTPDILSEHVVSSLV